MRSPVLGPYKAAWSNEAAFEEFHNMVKQGVLDKECIEALIHQEEKVIEIQKLLTANL